MWLHIQGMLNSLLGQWIGLYVPVRWVWAGGYCSR